MMRTAQLGVFCVLVLVAIFVLPWNNNKYALILKEQLVSQDNTPLPANKVVCNKQPSKYHGQSHEDKALYEKFFSNPTVCNGTYLEVGAFNGFALSNTLMFERDLNWNGILIEASPDTYKILQKNRPKSHLFPYAVCKEGVEHVDFVANGIGPVHGIGNEMNDHHIKRFHLKSNQTIKVPCKTLGGIIKAIGYRSLDFAVIDVEGAELMVLETHDWSIPVHVFVVEMNRQQEEIRSLFNKHGYSKASWDIRDFCPNSKGCMINEVFINDNWKDL